VLARRSGGKFVLRIEDLDAPRVVEGSRARIEADLRWLGLDWDETAPLQSERSGAYREAIGNLMDADLVYPCDCSRADVARVASAPHPGEEAVYPGLCRDEDPARTMKRPAAQRVRVPHDVIEYDDPIAGPVRQRLDQDVGDFVLRRGDGMFSYHLAVVVDDAAMGITHVVRGADLLSSTPRQLWLARALGLTAPTYLHVPMVVGSDGSRLSKRTPGSIVREHREAGVEPARIVGELAHGLGLMPTNAPVTPAEVVRASKGGEIKWRKEPWPVPRSLARSE
jgi:glutamyl-tRNA synthetase